MNLRNPIRTLGGLGAMLALVVVVLAAGSGRAAAGIGNYTTTLYLGGAASSLLATGNGLVTGGGLIPSATPTATAGSTGVLTGSYTYEYTESDSGGETAPSAASGTVTVSSKSITVGNLPTGVNVNLYRKGSTGIYRLVTTLAGNASSTYSDNTSDTVVNTQAILPLSQNKQPSLATGYFEFAPRTPMVSTSAVSTTLSSPSFDGKGWLVDAGGGVAFPSGTWTFTTNIKGLAGNGTAHLVIGMWVLNASGSVVSQIIDPTSAGENTTANIATTAGTASPIVTTIASVPAFSVASSNHLYVQLWRRQTAYSTGNPTDTLYAYDGITKIQTPTPTSMPDTPALGSVGSRLNSAPSLSATYVEPDNNGTLTFQLCSDSACNTVVDSHTSGTLASGGNASWTPTATLANGATYYARVQAQDSLGNTTPWSGTKSFVYDTSPPGTPTLASPSGGARVNGTTVTVTYVDSDATDTGGTVAFQLCGNSSCSSVVDTASVARATSSWTPAGHADGTYWWRAQETDTAGNVGSWSATRSFTLDTTAPATPVVNTTASLVHAAPQLSGAFSDPDAGDGGTVAFRLCSDSGCSGVAQTGSVAATNGATETWTPSGLADGTYWWQARGTDTAGNSSSWSAAQSFQLDTTAPAATPASVAARTNTTPQLGATFTDPDSSDSGTIALELCATSSCGTLLQSTTSGTLAKGATATWTPTSLADGTYWWRAQATDAAGNQSAWVSGSFVVDTVAPSTPALSSPAASARVNGVQLGAGFADTDSGDTGTISFQICSDSACASVAASGSSATVAAGGTTSWSASGLADGTYYWRARATDAAGNQSGWSAARVLTLDTLVPSAPSLGGPADAAYLAATPSLAATFVDADAGDSGSISFQVCTDSGCAAVATSGSSASGLASGASGTWTPSWLTGGTYWWRAAGVDAAGNTSTWSATRSFVVDDTPPTVSPGSPADGTRTQRPPALAATYADPGAPGYATGTVSFEICSSPACGGTVASGTVSSVAQGATATWTPASLEDGTYWWHVRAQDAAGNWSGWSSTSSLVIDATPPPAPTLAGRPFVHVPATPALGAFATDPGDPSDQLRLLVELCADADCASLVGTHYTASVAPGGSVTWDAGPLPDGVYYWRALSEDLLGNQSVWSAARPFVVDTTPPAAPQPSGSAVGTVVRKASLGATFPGGDGTDRGNLEFEVCADAACTAVVADGASATLAPGTSASWTPGRLTDGAYFWRVRARDEAGNASDWSQPAAFTLDQTPPMKPRAVTATVSRGTLTLRWRPPAGREPAAAYVLVVNGRAATTVTTTALVLHVRLRPGDRRTFAIAAVDRAGNVSVATPAFSRTTPVVKQTKRRR